MSGIESNPSSKARRSSTQCGGITMHHPDYFISVTSTPCPPPHALKFWDPFLFNFFILYPRKKILNQNDVEFDFSIGDALVVFPLFWIINKKCSMDHVCPPRPPQNSYISIYFVRETLFSRNPMIIISGCLRNTTNYSKITLFHIGSSAYYQIVPFTKGLSHNYADNALTSNTWKGHNFHSRDLNFSVIFPNTIPINNKN